MQKICIKITKPQTKCENDSYLTKVFISFEHFRAKLDKTKNIFQAWKNVTFYYYFFFFDFGPDEQHFLF